MFQNYVMIAIRNIGRDKLFSLINLGGLAASLSACLLIFLFVWSELNFDNWVTDGERIYRVEATYSPMGREPVPATTVGGPMRAALESDFPSDIEYASRLFSAQQTVARDDRVFRDTVNYVDSDFFSIFPFDFIAGSADATLADNRSIALSRTMAGKYFGDASPLGEILTITGGAGTVDYRVVAVFEDLPDTSHIAGQMYAYLDEPFWTAAFPNIFSSWINISSYTYLKLRPGADAATLEGNFPAFVDRYNVKPPVASYADVAPHDFVEYTLVNVRDIHLAAVATGDMKPHGSIVTVYAFSGIALLLVIIASINFVNLSTARSIRRSREVALRKTLGARRWQLILQFVGESMLTVFAALLVALVGAELLLPWYNGVLDSGFELATLATLAGVTALIFFGVVISVLSGAYPAFYLARVKPATVLHANRSDSAGSSRLRAILVTFQFAVSIGLVAATMVLYQQTSYVNGLDLGFNKDNITVLRMNGTDDPHGDAIRFRDRVRQLPGVTSVGLSGFVPSDQNVSSAAVFSPAIESEESISIRPILVGFGFFETFGIRPVAGRLFGPDFGTDMLPVTRTTTGTVAGSVILNERAVQRLGFDGNEDALGQVIVVVNGANLNLDLMIVGVVGDVQIDNARQAIQPLLFFYSPPGIGVVSMRVNPVMFSEVEQGIEEIWRDMFPARPLTRQYMDALLEAQYQDDIRQGQILGAFALLTIIVAGLGLFGLAAYSAERRTKEVGIRKILGASNLRIVGLFVWNLAKPIVIANALAWPAVWYFMDDWLAGFVYRIDMTLSPLIVAGSAVTVFGILTVAGRTYGVAKSRPANILRCE